MAAKMAKKNASKKCRVPQKMALSQMYAKTSFTVAKIFTFRTVLLSIVHYAMTRYCCFRFSNFAAQHSIDSNELYLLIFKC